MNRNSRHALTLALVVAAIAAGRPAAAQDKETADRAIAALQAAAGVEMKITRSPKTDLATFLAAPAGRFFQVPDRTALTPQDRAQSFIAVYGGAFGLRGGEDALVSRVERDSLGIDHVRMRQVRSGIPVAGGEIIVHLRGNRVQVASGKTLGGLDSLSLDPAVTAAEASDVARRFAEARLNAPLAELSQPRLEILNQALLGGREFPTRLAWFIEAKDETLREFIWIDAKSRTVLLNFSQLTEAKNRAIYDGNSTATLPGTLIRTEGQTATGNALLTDAINAYNYSGNTYDYFFTEHGRDSFDNAGAQLQSTIRHCASGQPCPYSNAFWNGVRMVYGAGFTSDDDVVAHELTHAVTERTANLFYYMQSGALNESFSDIFGESVDQWNGDPEPGGSRWLLGEELPGGAIRNMLIPTNFGDPGKMTDSQFSCPLDPLDGFSGDSGGVHSNSGVPNHAYALMVDGGGYNNFTISGIGLTKAAKIQYRALTTYLTSASDFLDNFNALQQACSDLIGTAGITAGNCTEVKKALDAVQMSNVWPCAPAQATPPALCSAGQHAVNVFFDNFESGLGNWTITEPPSPQPGVVGWWSRASDPSNFFGGLEFGTSGVDSLWAYDRETAADASVALAANLPTLPAGARLHFNHSFGFDSTATNYDGGVLEFSTTGAAPWSDASSLFMAGAAYGGVIAGGHGNPLAGRSAFVKDSFGYTASQYNLSSLAGQSSVRFRFRIGGDDDPFVNDYGWFIDDFRVYQCVADPAPTVVTTSPTAISQTGATLNGSVNPNGFSTTALFEYGATTGYGTLVPVPAPGSGMSAVPMSAAISGLTCGTTYHARAVATNSGGTTNGGDVAFVTALCPLPPAAITDPAGPIGSFGATLNGSVNPNGFATTTVFDYGLTNGYGAQVSAAPPPGSGTSDVLVSAGVTGLTCNTLYHFRVSANNVNGTTNGLDQTFTTAACPPPTATTGGATLVTSSGATLGGTVNPNGLSTTAVFDYGLTNAYGTQAPALPPPGSGFAGVGVSAAISGLTCNTTYHYRLSATNLGGPINGSDQTFTTSACLLSIGDAALAEGNAGTSTMTFMVALAVASSQTVTVSALTSDITAVAGVDYVAAGPQTLTFNPGTLSQPFSVTIQGDTQLESDDAFLVTLSNPTNVVIDDGTAIGTIQNDELSTRTFVSASGNDASACSVQTTPCRNIAGALAQTAVDGEIIILSPGEYESAPLLINKSIKITSPTGTVAFIRQPLTITAPGARVVLRGLTFKGEGTGDAITFTAGTSVSIEDCGIDGWTSGMRIANTTAARISVNGSVFQANTTGLKDTPGGPANRVIVEDSRFEGNTTGVDLAVASLVARETSFVGQATSGVLVGAGSADIQRCAFTMNGTAVSASSGGTVRIGRSWVFGNTLGLSAAGGSTFLSGGTNVIRGNATDTAGTIGAIPEQ